ncbi:hypothetical protein EJB05_40039 [Eragrostis curvula]|uniref:Jasmonate O-methyltransferase n=1 Tax=Eragrostis curvula TaxID=38414 RepID=A0A5J9U0H4_9POAL|nr:hypothetical protein EJB05_40039 [Eragrostis curvula]
MVVVTAESNTVAQQLDLKNVLCMEAGQGNTSYINNSQAQSRTFEKTVHVLKETLDKLQLPRRPKKLLKVADLGCSCGHNTLIVADLIVQHMEDLYRARSHPPPEFCFYFSDLPSNDFNTLFHLLPDHSAEASRRRYFGAGVPGSFYDRLFPERFINMFSSTFSLHWLSQVPGEVLDKRSAAYNKGKVFVHGASEATGLSYKRQFQSDLARFLRCRAAELKPGGAMFLVCLGRPSSTAPTDQGTVRYLFGAMFQDAWADLVDQGLMDGEKMDIFNVPVYAPTLEEFRDVVDADGSFRINRLELVVGSPPVVDRADDPGAVGRAVANNERSLLGALVDAHVGNKALGDELFRRLQRRAEERARELMDEMRFPHVVCSLSLCTLWIGGRPACYSSYFLASFLFVVTEEMVSATVQANAVALAPQDGVKNVFCMGGGQGETSYINNSQVQSRNLQMAVDVLKETLGTIQLSHPPEKLLTAADLGCSCGQNTLFVADAIVQHMTEMYAARGHAAPEFCFYFSDLPSNDFNTLFRLLTPADHSTAAAAAEDDYKGSSTRRRKYFAAGVPGSFHDRLFPARFVDAFTTTFSVHWLSRVPREAADERHAAFNKGKVFVHGASAATGAAYKRQFQSDLGRFLRCRAAELKPGGAMFLLCLGRPSADPTDQGRVRLLYGTLFEDSWADLVREGLVKKDKMDSFNVPLYAPTLDEFREAVDADGAFRINRLEMVTGSAPVVDRPDDAADVGRTVANNVRSFVGALVDAHVGKSLADELFARMQRRAERRARELMEEMRLPHVVCSLSLA